jgi:hypothetical protein
MNTLPAYGARETNEPEIDRKAATGTDKHELQSALIRQISDAIPLPDHLLPFEQGTLKETAVAALEDICPRDIMEGMLAAQFVATHYVAMDCYKRAAAAGLRLDVWERYLRQAERLMSTGLRMVEALDRHRGKGAANVNVGNYLNVEAGGQAVVGMQARVGQAGVDAEPLALAQGLGSGGTGVASEGSAPVQQDAKAKRLAQPMPAQRESPGRE